MTTFIALVTNVPRVEYPGLYLVGEKFNADQVPESYLRNKWVAECEPDAVEHERVSTVHEQSDNKMIETKKIQKKGRKHEG